MAGSSQHMNTATEALREHVNWILAIASIIHSSTPVLADM